MEIPIYHVNAFADRPFAGNPAAVCLLNEWPDDGVLQAIANQNNLSETAFVDVNDLQLRWFTPVTEVDLCGHATLAAAFVLFETGRVRTEVRFDTLSGPLTVTREIDSIILDFPAFPSNACEPESELATALGAPPAEVFESRFAYLAVYGTESEVRALQPDMTVLTRLTKDRVIVTAPGDDVDFVSRFFAPLLGVPEDPVTGSAHCTLAPFWAARIGRDRLHARQVSRRGGELWCEVYADGVRIAGRAVEYLTGRIRV
jgi:PhzF family phenazine biosynthesis protein